MLFCGVRPGDRKTQDAYRSSRLNKILSVAEFLKVSRIGFRGLLTEESSFSTTSSNCTVLRVAVVRETGIVWYCVVDTVYSEMMV